MYIVELRGARPLHVLPCRKRAAECVGLFVAVAFFVDDLDVLCLTDAVVGVVDTVGDATADALYVVGFMHGVDLLCLCNAGGVPVGNGSKPFRPYLHGAGHAERFRTVPYTGVRGICVSISPRELNIRRILDGSLRHW